MNDTAIHRGANVLLERQLVEADGTTPIAPSDLVFCEVELRQGERLVKKFVLGTDAELRANGDDTALLLEITSAISQKFTRGAVSERWRLGLLAESYTAEPNKSLKVLVVHDLICLS